MDCGKRHRPLVTLWLLTSAAFQGQPPPYTRCWCMLGSLGPAHSVPEEWRRKAAHPPSAAETGAGPGRVPGAGKQLCAWNLAARRKPEVGHFPPGEKYNNTRKRQALWECSKWESQCRPGRQQRDKQPGGQARLSAEPRTLSATSLCPLNAALKWLPGPALAETIEGRGISCEVCHRKGRDSPRTHSHTR